MAGVNKIYPPSKQVLKNIYLGFFYGAKIGVLGLNGSGKSSLLRIIAGIDKEFQGEVVSDQSFTVGLLEQEPQLDKNKTVNYLFSPSTNIMIKDFKGLRAIVTGEESLDERWPNTPVIEIVTITPVAPVTP